MTKDSFTVKYTNKDIIEKLEDLKGIQESCIGCDRRVTVIERQSVGLWISNNPFKFMLFCLCFVSLVISDLRHPLISFLVGLI